MSVSRLRHVNGFDAIDQFRAAIESAGLTPPECIEADGKLRRFSSSGKRGDAAGWYVLHGDGVPAGRFGCWRSGLDEAWRADVGRDFTQQEKAEYSRRMRDAKAARDAAEKEDRKKARESAREILDHARPVPDDHCYLSRKGIKAHGLQVHDGKLVVPMRDADGTLHSLQTIAGDGTKRFLPGGRKSGCFHVLGELGDTFLIAEGFATGATLHEATGMPVVVAFDAGNLEPVAFALRSKFPRARIVICADDDHHTDGNPGIAKAMAAAKAIAARVVVPEFGEGRPEGATDFNDLAAHAGIEAVHAQIAREAAGERTGGRLRLKWLHDIKPRLSALWRVHGVLPQEGLAVVFGESGSGKTFLTLQIALHVATGTDWCGRRCKPGVVVYIAAENPSSAENRIAAWLGQHPDASNAPLAVLPQSIALNDSSPDVSEILALLADVERKAGPIAMVVVDTLARAMGVGDENKAADMGGVVKSCDAIRETFTTLVVLVHHAGKDSARGARGHSSLKAAADVEIEVTANDASHAATVTKLRDGPTGARFTFNLEPVLLGHDDDGAEVTSCLVTDLEESADGEARPRGARPARLPPAQRIALDALDELLKSKETRRNAPQEAQNGGARIGQYVATVEAWRKACYFRGISDRNQDAKRMAFNRAAQALQAGRRVQIGGDYAWLCNE